MSGPERCSHSGEIDCNECQFGIENKCPKYVTCKCGTEIRNKAGEWEDMCLECRLSDPDYIRETNLY